MPRRWVDLVRLDANGQRFLSQGVRIRVKTFKVDAIHVAARPSTSTVPVPRHVVSARGGARLLEGRHDEVREVREAAAEKRAARRCADDDSGGRADACGGRAAVGRGRACVGSLGRIAAGHAGGRAFVGWTAGGMPSGRSRRRSRRRDSRQRGGLRRGERGRHSRGDQGRRRAGRKVRGDDGGTRGGDRRPDGGLKGRHDGGAIDIGSPAARATAATALRQGEYFAPGGCKNGTIADIVDDLGTIGRGRVSVIIFRDWRQNIGVLVVQAEISIAHTRGSVVVS